MVNLLAANCVLLTQRDVLFIDIINLYIIIET